MKRSFALVKRAGKIGAFVDRAADTPSYAVARMLKLRRCRFSFNFSNNCQSVIPLDCILATQNASFVLVVNIIALSLA